MTSDMEEFVNELLDANGLTFNDVVDAGGIAVKDGRKWIRADTKNKLVMDRVGRECDMDTFAISEEMEGDGWVLKRMTFTNHPNRFYPNSLDAIFGKDVNAVARKCEIVKKHGMPEKVYGESPRRISREVDDGGTVWAKNLREDDKITDGTCYLKDGTPCNEK